MPTLLSARVFSASLSPAITRFARPHKGKLGKEIRTERAWGHSMRYCLVSQIERICGQPGDKTALPLRLQDLGQIGLSGVFELSQAILCHQRVVARVRVEPLGDSQRLYCNLGLDSHLFSLLIAL